MDCAKQTSQQTVKKKDMDCVLQWPNRWGSGEPSCPPDKAMPLYTGETDAAYSKYFFCDLETTGIYRGAFIPKILELSIVAAGQFPSVKGEMEFYNSLCNPHTDSFQKEALDKNELQLSHVEGWPSPQDALLQMYDFAKSRCDAPVFIFWNGVGFDEEIIKEAFGSQQNPIEKCMDAQQIFFDNYDEIERHYGIKIPYRTVKSGALMLQSSLDDIHKVMTGMQKPRPHTAYSGALNIREIFMKDDFMFRLLCSAQPHDTGMGRSTVFDIMKRHMIDTYHKDYARMKRHIEEHSADKPPAKKARVK